MISIPLKSGRQLVLPAHALMVDITNGTAAPGEETPAYQYTIRNVYTGDTLGVCSEEEFKKVALQLVTGENQVRFKI